MITSFKFSPSHIDCRYGIINCSRLVFLLVIILTLELLLASEDEISLQEVSRNFYENSWSKDPSVSSGSYLFSGNRSMTEDVLKAMIIEDLTNAIHLSQHPPIHECAYRRLLVADFVEDRLEGTGSILRELTISLSTAMHSTRILIWGYRLPMIFKDTSSLWKAQNDKDKKRGAKFKVGKWSFRCPDSTDSTGGLYNCFFLPITSCAISRDSTQEERKYISRVAFNVSSRISVVEDRKSLGAYYPPYSLFEKLVRKYESHPLYNQTELARFRRHLWASALTAYIFRLKDNVSKKFWKKYSYIFRDEAATTSSEGTTNASVWAIHVRHGDVESLRKTYSYKPVFDFPDYFAHAKDLSNHIKMSPKRIYLATDSARAPESVKLFKQFNRKISKSKSSNFTANSSAIYKAWYGDSVTPSLVVLDNDNRYRNVHGSHTVAADGACVREPELELKGLQVCAVDSMSMAFYRQQAVHYTTPRHFRVVKAFLESLEDLYIISQCDALIATGSSYYSSFASLLIWARTGASNATDTIQFLDAKAIESGEVPTGYLPNYHYLEFAMNIVKLPDEKWIQYTEEFISGLKNFFQPQFFNLHYNPWSQDNRIRIVDGLPYIPASTFYRDAGTWLGLITDSEKFQVWPGGCMLPSNREMEDMSKFDEIKLLIFILNIGSNHSSLQHFGNALDCWIPVLRYSEIKVSNYLGDDELYHKRLKNVIDAANRKIAGIAFPIFAV